VCGLSGAATVTIRFTDLDLGTVTTGAAFIRCVTPGEHVNWVALINAIYRPGDRALVDATATGSIIDEDQKEVVIKQFH